MHDIEPFIARYTGQQFPHREALLEGLRTGEYTLLPSPEGELSPVDASQLLRIYRARVIHLRRFSSPHAAQLRRSVEALCAELERNPDERVLLRTFGRGAWHYDVFESKNCGRVLGCMHSIDRRRMAAEAWDALWGELDAGAGAER